MPNSDEREIIKQKQQQLQQYQLQQAVQLQQQFIVQDQQQQTTHGQHQQHRRTSQQQHQRGHRKKNNSSNSKVHEKAGDTNNVVYDIQDSHVVPTSSAHRSGHKPSLSQSSQSTYSSGQPLLNTTDHQQLQHDYIPNDYNMSQQQQQRPHYNHPYDPPAVSSRSASARGDRYKAPPPRHQYPQNLSIDTTAAQSSRGQWNAQTPDSTDSRTKSYGYAIPGGAGAMSLSHEEDLPHHNEASYERELRRMREQSGQHQQHYQQRPLSSQHPNPNDTRPLSPSSNTIGTMESGGRAAGDRYKLLEDDNAMSSFENDQQYRKTPQSQQQRQQRRQQYNEHQQQQQKQQRRPSSSRSGRARRSTQPPPTLSPTTPNTPNTFSTFSPPTTPRSTYFKNGSVSTESGMFGSFETSIIDTIGENDVFYVKQKYAYFSIVLSVLQLLVMTIMMALCGVAPLDVNPMVGPYPDTLSYWGGKNAYLMTNEGEFWRFISPIMLHAGVIHLFCNVAVQLETGAFFEREWGSVIWVIVYVTAAIGSTVTSCLSRPNSISVGSSGALMGLFGAKLSEVFCISCFTMSRRGVFKGYNIHMEQLGGVLCSVAIVSLFSFIPFVDWAGHMGGLCTGFSVGMIIFSFQIESKRYRILWGCLGSLFLITFMISCFWFLYEEVYPDEELGDVCEYYRQIFYEGYECACQVQ